MILKNKIFQFGTSLMLFFMVFNASNAQVRSDYDKNADFTKYKTYTFKGWEKDSDKQLNDFDKKRITDAFITELSKRDLTSDNNNPDLGITLFVVIAEKTSKTAYTNGVWPLMGMGCRHGLRNNYLQWKRL